MHGYPDAQGIVRRDIILSSGYRIATYNSVPAAESKRKVLLLLNGGPGLPCEYLLVPHLRLVENGWTVISYDQLGCGASDRPDDPSLWTLDGYVRELEEIVGALGLEQFCLLGHSWGTWLGTEFALRNQSSIRKYIVADGACDIPHLVTELQRLREALGHETVQMMVRRETDGSISHPEYQAAITLLNYRHVCRLDAWPAPLTRSLKQWNMGPYNTMQGPNEFTYTGNMANWNRIPAMAQLRFPCLVLAGEFDELPPSCSFRICNALPHASLRVFENCSHLPFYEDPENYFACLLRFLDH